MTTVRAAADSNTLCLPMGDSLTNGGERLLFLIRIDVDSQQHDLVQHVLDAGFPLKTASLIHLLFVGSSQLRGAKVTSPDFPLPRCKPGFAANSKPRTETCFVWVERVKTVILGIDARRFCRRGKAYLGGSCWESMFKSQLPYLDERTSRRSSKGVERRGRRAHDGGRSGWTTILGVVITENLVRIRSPSARIADRGNFEAASKVF